jgi:hypothetical protein
MLVGQVDDLEGLGPSTRRRARPAVQMRLDQALVGPEQEGRGHHGQGDVPHQESACLGRKAAQAERGAQQHEKKLSQLFDEARASGAILFFDEADAIFGRRTEVKDAHDRYANREIGLVLERMEERTGTTRAGHQPRGQPGRGLRPPLRLHPRFPHDAPRGAAWIWEGMLSQEGRATPGIDVDRLARDYPVSLREIRNSVLSAAFIAAEEGVRELVETGRALDGKQRLALEGD